MHAVDALWAVALFIPAVYGSLTGIDDFDPDPDTRLIIWAVRKPIERRGVILLTTFPIVFVFTLMALFNVIDGDTLQI